jgi:thermostable 8-oxoguanine DNA glycosylase
MIRTLYQDKYNPQKTWEVTSISHGFYLRQYICDKQFGRGLKTSREYLKNIGILDMPILAREEVKK